MLLVPVQWFLCNARAFEAGDVAFLAYTVAAIRATAGSGGGGVSISISGETVSYAYDFIDPYCIVMNTCATEFVKGGQLRVGVQGNPSFRPSLIVNGFLPIDQQNPVAATPIINIDNGGIIPMSVIINGGDWNINPAAPNLTAPKASGSGLKVRMIGVNGSPKSIWNISASADVQEF